jgi:hypothetical protein
MTITKEEVYKDYMRFVRHEAMRANCKQWEILKIISNGDPSNS